VFRLGVFKVGVFMVGLCSGLGFSLSGCAQAWGFQGRLFFKLGVFRVGVFSLGVFRLAVFRLVVSGLGPININFHAIFSIHKDSST
jgi:hypothetical protein